jgi:hypothetical protein
VSDASWDDRLADAWASINEMAESDFFALIEDLAAELPQGSAIAAFERASAFDSFGYPDRAVPVYREALGPG